MRIHSRMLAVAAGLLVAATAHAQPADWTGWYVGGFGAFAVGELTAEDESHKETTGMFDDDGPMAGIYGGYRHQNPQNWVYGGEVVLPLYMQEGTAVDTVFFPGEVTYEGDPLFGIFVGGQVGKAIGRFLPYAFGNVGLARVEGKTFNVDENENLSPGFVQSSKATHFAWQLGAGTDVLVGNDFFVGARVAAFIGAKADHTVPWNEPGPNKFGYRSALFQVNVGRNL